MKYTTKHGNRVYKRSKSSKNWTHRTIRDGKTLYFNLGKDLDVAKAMADEIDAYLVFNTVSDTLLKYAPQKKRGKAKPKPKTD